MKFLLDEGIPRSAAALIRSLSFDCDHVADVGLGGHEDTEIIEWARESKSIIVTLDADFHALVATSASPSPSVVRIRIQGMKGADIAAIISNFSLVHAGALESGALLTITTSRTSMHLLPVLKDSPPTRS